MLHRWLDGKWLGELPPRAQTLFWGSFRLISSVPEREMELPAALACGLFVTLFSICIASVSADTLTMLSTGVFYECETN